MKPPEQENTKKRISEKQRQANARIKKRIAKRKPERINRRAGRTTR